MKSYATDRLNDVESVADEAVIADSVAEPLDKPIKTNNKKNTPKESIEECKVLYWNKYSKNFAFEYKGKTVQITLSEPMLTCGTVIKVQYKDNKYTII